MIANRAARTLGLFLSIAFLAIVACDDDAPNKPKPVTPGPEAVADFSLPDLNPNSPTFGDTISPRDSLGRISCWYFGAAT